MCSLHSMGESTVFRDGAEDVIAAESSITAVDGLEGKLSYRGYDIHDLARNTTYEEVVYLLWNGELPTRRELDALRIDLDANRALPDASISIIKQFPKDASPIDALRTTVSLLSFSDPDASDNSIVANERKALRLTARMGTIVAALARLSQGEEIIAPVSGKGTAWNFLYMLKGEAPSDVAEHALDVALVLHADHELTASTFVARVAVETLTDMYSAVTAAIGTLAGRLHGGADIEVMHMLEQIGMPKNAAGFVSEALSSGRKLMGFGDRVYKTIDPRAVSLRQVSLDLAEGSGNRKWYDISQALEVAADRALAARGKTTLKANVDLFSASVYRVLDIPTDYFTCVFAISRVCGWSAHILEQLRNNKLIRPRAVYTGPVGRVVIPIGERSDGIVGKK